MAEVALPSREPRRPAAMPVPKVRPLQPWVDAGVPLVEWLASLEDDPPPGEDMVPMTAPHARAMGYTANALVLRLRGQRVEVGADLPMVFTLADENGVPQRGRLSPDVLVAFGVQHRAAVREYDADANGAPDFVLEVLSRSTWQRDVAAKLKTYAAIGVRECFLFDPAAELSVPVLQGFALTKQSVQPLPVETVADGRHGVRSDVLRLVACVGRAGGEQAKREPGAPALRWHDPETGRDLPSPAEETAARMAAEQATAHAERQRDELAHRHAATARQRDELARQHEATTRQRDELARQHEATTRQRDELARQRDEATRERDELAQQRDETVRRIAELEDLLRRSERRATD